MTETDTQVVSNGETFIPAGFDITLPDEDDSDIPKCILTLDDVDLSLRTELVKLQKFATVTVLLMRIANPNNTYEFIKNGKLRIAHINEPFAAVEVHVRDDRSTAPYPAFRWSRGFGYLSTR